MVIPGVIASQDPMVIPGLIKAGFIPPGLIKAGLIPPGLIFPAQAHRSAPRGAF